MTTVLPVIASQFLRDRLPAAAAFPRTPLPPEPVAMSLPVVLHSPSATPALLHPPVGLDSMPLPVYWFP